MLTTNSAMVGACCFSDFSVQISWGRRSSYSLRLGRIDSGRGDRLRFETLRGISSTPLLPPLPYQERSNVAAFWRFMSVAFGSCMLRRLQDRRLLSAGRGCAKTSRRKHEMVLTSPQSALRDVCETCNVVGVRACARVLCYGLAVLAS